ncbi:hypothetical protein Ancab_021231 [Ancistrocladus abbreviatus]
MFFICIQIITGLRHSTMKCLTLGLVSHLLSPSCCPKQSTLSSCCFVRCNVATGICSHNFSSSLQSSSVNPGMSSELWRFYSMPVEWGDYTEVDEIAVKESPDELLAKPASSDELKALLADTQRTNLVKKLSEANQHNRFLKRQLQLTEDSLVNFKSELAVMEHEIQALVVLAEEIAKSGSPEHSRKINGKYIQSHILSRLQALQKKLKEQIKDVEAAQPKEVPLYWIGMAESVQVMGSFDGWSQGEYLSSEYLGSYTKFSTTLSLRPGRYEMKFLVDGVWQLSPEFPTVGEGMMKNNLLIVK